MAPELIIIKVCVTRHFIRAGEEGMGQGATLPIKRVPVVVIRAGKRHSDVPFSYRPSVVTAVQLMEIQGGYVAPGFEGASQDVVHYMVSQAG